MRLLTREIAQSASNLEGTTLFRQEAQTASIDGVSAPPALVARFGESALDGCTFCSGTVSTQARASDGHVLQMPGYRGDFYARSGSVLWRHDISMPSIGRAVAYVDGETLRADIAFLPRDISPLAYEIGQVAKRFGHAMSVGFDIDEATPSAQEIRSQIPWALEISAWTLREMSAVNIGADAGAFLEASRAGAKLEAVRAALAKEMESTIKEEVRRAIKETIRAFDGENHSLKTRELIATAIKAAIK